MGKQIQQRRKKTAKAVAAMQEVQYATEAAMKAVISYLQSTVSPTSEEAHKIIDSVLLMHNCESPEGHIVAGGVQGAQPHEIGSGLLKKRSLIVIDIYPRSKETGYFADMTRTVCIGTPPKKLQNMYDTVLKAQKVAISMVRPNVHCIDIQNAVEEVFKNAGYLNSGTGEEFPFREGFVHGVGHGVGKNIHESPRIGRGSIDVLRVGDVVTIEPGLYYKKIGGVRIEDMVLVTSTTAQKLTHFQKKLKI